MALLGQASGGFTESSSALRLLHVGKRNTVGVLTDDAFTQANPPIRTAAAEISTNVDRTAHGVLSGSIAYCRNDGGENFIGGPTADGAEGGADDPRERPLGVFINSANSNPYTNTPASASGKGPYVSGFGTYGNALFETADINGGGAITYTNGDLLVGSLNGYLTNNIDANNNHDRAHVLLDGQGVAVTYTIGILKMAPDATQNELVYDQRL